MSKTPETIHDCVIIGAGPAGLAAALSLADCGIKDILILERDDQAGGILNQCIHNGFGLHTFNEELTGPEYALRYIEKTKERSDCIKLYMNTMVMDIQPSSFSKQLYELTACSSRTGVSFIYAKSVILAMGCRERPRGALNIPGYRPAGIYSAGTAQKLINIDGLMPGREVVILGSGDIGLIMARRLTLEGAKVKMVVEIMPYSGGLRRNIVQCLDDFGIPLLLGHTVTQINGRDRIESVEVSSVDDDLRPVEGSGQLVSCDTLLLSVGLIPENELSKKLGVAMSGATKGAVVGEDLMTSCPGVFACGNVLHVHDLVDNVSKEAVLAGKKAAEFIRSWSGDTLLSFPAPLPDSDIMKRFSAKNPSRNSNSPDAVTKNPDGSTTRTIPCITCPKGCMIDVTVKSGKVVSVSGNSCDRGDAYARAEVMSPVRIFTSSVKVLSGKRPVVPVRTKDAIPKDKTDAVIHAVRNITVSAPVAAGSVILSDAAGTGVDIIATADVLSSDQQVK